MAQGQILALVEVAPHEALGLSRQPSRQLAALIVSRYKQRTPPFAQLGRDPALPTHQLCIPQQPIGRDQLLGLF